MSWRLISSSFWDWDWDWCVYPFFCNGHLGFRSYSGSLSKSAKVTKALMPHHSVPRLGSACPHSGIAPWAAAKGHPWPSAAIPASMPGCPLRNACVRPAWLTGRPRSTSTTRRPNSRPGSWWDRVSPMGASLLAIAVGQLAVMLAVPTSSRAGSLPQDFVSRPDAVNIHNPLWERVCSR